MGTRNGDNVPFLESASLRKKKRKAMKSVTSPLHESRLHWIHDPNPNQSHRVEPKKTVPRNNTVQNSDSIPRNPLDPIPSASWYNSSYPVPSASPPRNSVHSHSHPVPRINKEDNSENEMSASATRSSPPPKKRRSRKRRIERRALERERVGIVHLFKMRAGPISEQQFQPFQQFQRQ